MSRPPLPIGRFYPDDGDPQTPADVVVQINTVMRPTLERAIDSVYAQDFAGRIQLAIGVDAGGSEIERLDGILARRPSRVSALLLALPYSTSMRHGGVHRPKDGGALHAVMSLAANGRHVAYLDDDNEWRPGHLRLLHAAVQGRVYAFSRRILVDEVTDRDLGLDIWDSVGPGRGRFRNWGGHVDPNCLIVDAQRAAAAFGAWAQTLGGHSDTADRRFFLSIAWSPHAEVPKATVRYRIRRTNLLHHLLRAGTDDPEVVAAIEARILAARKAPQGV